jgi:hypothetical protein
MSPRSRLSRSLRKLHHIVFTASRDGRSSEIAAWSNAAAALLLGAGAFALTRSWPFGIGLAVVSFVLLRGALTHRLTVWVAASLGTLAIGGLGGALAWLFAHVIEQPAVPSIAAVIGAVTSATLPAWAYANLGHRRARHERDSLLDPIPLSRG